MSADTDTPPTEPRATLARSPRPPALWALAAGFLFLSAGALFGGASLLRDPSGASLQLPLSLLAHSPFSDYRVPGAVLFVVLGVLPLPGTVALLARARGPRLLGHAWPWSLALAIALAFVVWMIVQALLIGLLGAIQYLYLAYALALLALVLAPSVRGHYRAPGADGSR
jgi:hypothetical protein